MPTMAKAQNLIIELLTPEFFLEFQIGVLVKIL